MIDNLSRECYIEKRKRTRGTPELAEKEFNYGTAENPMACPGCYRSGSAVFANVYRDMDGFCLLISPVTMEQPPEGDNFIGGICGWMRPEKPSRPVYGSA